MNVYVILSTLLALVLYIPLCVQIFTGKVKQNLATWILWGVLDGIAMLTLIVQKGNWLLTAAYVLGSFVTSLCIARSKNFAWTWFENFVVFLVVVCLVVWATSGSQMATVASSLAVVIAGVPQVFDTYRKPWDTPIFIYIGYFFANVLSIVGAKNWSIEERFYPICAGALCFVIVICAIRKLWVRDAMAPFSVSRSVR